MQFITIKIKNIFTMINENIKSKFYDIENSDVIENKINQYKIVM